MCSSKHTRLRSQRSQPHPLYSSFTGNWVGLCVGMDGAQKMLLLAVFKLQTQQPVQGCSPGCQISALYQITCLDCASDLKILQNGEAVTFGRLIFRRQRNINTRRTRRKSRKKEENSGVCAENLFCCQVHRAVPNLLIANTCWRQGRRPGEVKY